jgi:hypothetical protein
MVVIAVDAMAVQDVRNSFWRNEDGSWICIDPVTIEHPKGRVQVSPGTTIKPGVPFMGVDLAAWLDEQRASDPNL